MRGRINIDKSGPLFRAFAWSIRLITAFTTEPLSKDYLNEGTDLCHFIRTFVITVPVIILLQIVAVVLPVLALFVMPAYWFGTSGLIYISIVYLTIGALIGSLISISIWRHSRNKAEREETKDPTVLNLMGTYLHAKKIRICPLIDWRDK